jgi:hypothetical protein
MHLKQVLGLLATSAALVAAEGETPDSKVEVLTKDSFDSFIGSNDLVLAECMYFFSRRPRISFCPTIGLLTLDSS